MDDIISRQAAINAHCELCDMNDKCICIYCKDIDMFESLPTAELSEYSDKLWKTAYERGKEEARPKGNWIPIKNTRLVECECGFITDRLCEYNFCPNCGARMREIKL